MTKNNKRRGRPPKYDMPERIDASPEEIAEVVLQAKPKPESTEGGRRVSVLKRQEGAPVLLG